MPALMPSVDVSASDQAHWSLALCGQAQAVSAQGRRHTLERRDAALLALLAIDGPTARSRAIDLLWPGEAPEQVRGRLRQRLFALRRKLGVDAVEGSQTLALSSTLPWPGFDHERADAPLLGDDDYADLPEFADWLQHTRNRLQTLRRERFAAQASELEQQGRLAEAIVCAEQLLTLEPLQEHAHRRLMRLHYLRGDRAAALLAFDRCERQLKDEVGAAPSAETLELLRLIDQSEPVDGRSGTLRRRAVPASVLRPPRLIGRDAEWARLQAAWERGDAIVVIGEGGMGKTRLLGDLVRVQAGTAGAAVQVSARPGDERLPYALLSRLLRALLGLRSAPLPAGVEAELARLLPELPQRDPGSAAGDAAAQARFVGAIDTTLKEAIDAGLQAVLLDDLHFADTASLEMAQHLSGNTGLRWLTAFRGAEIGAAAQDLVDTLTGTRYAEPIELQPLSAGQVAELVESLGIEALDAHTLASHLHQRSGGNPLFLLETLKALLLSEQPGAADARALARLPIEGSAVRLIERRIAQLSRDAVRLARCAAIAGHDFSASLAARVLEVNPLDLTDAWQELESAQVLRDGAFAHDLIFEAARASVPGPIARALHRRIAELLEAEGATPSSLAAHWLGAGEALRAAPKLAEAGRQALRTMRMREGVQYLDEAQSIYGQCGDVDKQCALIDELIAPAVMTSSFDKIQRLVEQAAQGATTDRQRSMTLRSLATLLAYRSEHDRARDVALQALDSALAAGDRACELGARCLLAELLADRCRAGDGEVMLRPIEGWVNAHGSGAQRIVFAQALAIVLQDCGKLAQALDQWQRAIDVARDIGAAHSLPDLLSMRATALLLTGRARQARDAMVEGRALLHDVPEDAMILRPFTIRLQIVDRMLGHYASSLVLGERVLSDPAAGSREADDASLAHAFAYCDLGQPARVHRLLSQTKAPADSFNGLFWKEVGAQMVQPTAQQHEARHRALEAAAEAARQWSGRSRLVAWRIQAHHADDDEAVAAARRGVEFATACGMGGQQLVFQALLAQRLAALGDTSEALWLARDSWRLMADFCPTMLYRGYVWRALIEVLEPHDASLGRTIVQSAADWIFRTASEDVPAPFRESFLNRNPANAWLLARAREL